MDTLFEAMGGMLKVLGFVMGVFLLGSLAVALLFVMVYSVFYMVAC